METSNTSISGVRTDLLIPESDTSTCTMIVMERRPNALEKYERLESKSDGYCQKSFYRQQLDECKTKKLTKHTKQCIQITQPYKTRKTGPASPKGSGAAGKAQNPKKRAFSLPYISYNPHYAKYYKNQKQRPLLLRSVIGAGFGSLCCSFISFLVWDAWIALPSQAGIVKYNWTRPLSCERPLHQTLQRCIQRLCSEVRADRFIVNARHCLTAFFAAKLCNVLFAGHKALFCQNRRTVYIFQ